MGSRYAVTSRGSCAHGAVLAAATLLAGCSGTTTDRPGSAPPARGATRAEPPHPAGAAAAASGIGTESNPCGGQGVLVTFTVAAFDGVIATDTAKSLPRLRSLTDRALAPVRERVTRVEYSPALRTARLALVDSASVRAVVAALSRSPEVGEVSLDACALKVQGRPQ